MWVIMVFDETVNPYVDPYMPDATGGILDAFDATDVILEIKYNLRRFELKETPEGKKEWVAPDGDLIKPLVNRVGEHDIINLLTAFMNRNIYLSSMPGKKEGDNFVYRLVNKFSHDIINLLGVNASKYEIQEPKHIALIIWIVVPNVFAALQMAVGAGGRTSVENILGESKIVQESVLPEGLK